MAEEETEQANAEKTPSMDQILESIRGAISGNENDKAVKEPVLELTEVVNSDGSISSLSNANTASDASANNSGETNDILNDIDNAIGVTSPTPEPAPTPAPASKSNQDEIDKLLAASSNNSLEKTIEEPKVEEPKPEETPIIEQPEEIKKPVEIKKTAPVLSEPIVENNEIQDEKPFQEKSEAPKKKRLISDETANLSSEALKSLVKKVSKPISDNFGFRSGNTVEDLIMEMIKPYMSEWLDANLPNIVKHIVEKEVQKLIPKDED